MISTCWRLMHYDVKISRADRLRTHYMAYRSKSECTMPHQRPTTTLRTARPQRTLHGLYNYMSKVSITIKLINWKCNIRFCENIFYCSYIVYIMTRSKDFVLCRCFSCWRERMGGGDGGHEGVRVPQLLGCGAHNTKFPPPPHFLEIIVLFFHCSSEMDHFNKIHYCLV